MVIVIRILPLASHFLFYVFTLAVFVFIFLDIIQAHFSPLGSWEKKTHESHHSAITNLLIILFKLVFHTIEQKIRPAFYIAVTVFVHLHVEKKVHFPFLDPPGPQTCGRIKTSRGISPRTMTRN